jgi:signal transduction histidine kinase
MSQPIHVKNHPFPFLLYLEWVLLAIALITEVLPTRLPRLYHSSVLTMLMLFSFAGMGLQLPAGKLVNKLVYTGVEILLILSSSMAGGRAIRLFPMLHLVLVMRSCLIFPLPGRLGVAGVSFFLSLLTLRQRFFKLSVSPAAAERLRFIPFLFTLLFGLVLVFVLLLMNALIAERQQREKLAIANQQLRQYAAQIEDQATLQERNRIAREIHDALGHSLTALNLQLETAIKLWKADPTRAREFLEQAKQLGSQALKDVRQSVSAMRHDPLQGRSLELAIADLCQEFSRSTGITPICDLDLQVPITAEIEMAVYRIVQEALTNISKFAQATEVKLTLQSTSSQLDLSITDNGQGFKLDQNTSGFGLQSMRDRALALNGTLKIETAPLAGCCITVNIPRSVP